MRVAAILHPYVQDSVLAPFYDERVQIFRGNQLERGNLPDAVIVFGGDGTVHRVLGALAGSECPLLVVPTGSGNDFAASIGIRSREDSVRAWRAFLQTGTNARVIDLGVISPADTAEQEKTAEPPIRKTWTYADEDGRIMAPERNLNDAIKRSQLRHVTEAVAHMRETYFCCISGIGLDAETNRIANRIPRWLRARGGYAIAALAALARYHSAEVSLTLDDGTRLTGSILLAAMGNSAEYGNGMRMLPKAKMDDGLLDVCFVESVPKPKVLRFFHTIYSGKHLAVREVRYAQTKSVRVKSAQPIPVYADGEFIRMTPVEVRIAPAALKVIC